MVQASPLFTWGARMAEIRAMLLVQQRTFLARFGATFGYAGNALACDAIARALSPPQPGWWSLNITPFFEGGDGIAIDRGINPMRLAEDHQGTILILPAWCEDYLGLHMLRVNRIRNVVLTAIQAGSSKSIRSVSRCCP